MSNGEELDITSVRLIPEFSAMRMEEDVVWVPDAVDLVLRPGTEPTGSAGVHHSNTCLEHVLRLLDRIDRGESGTVVWGSSGIGVDRSENDRIRLAHKGITLVGSPDEVRAAVEGLAGEVFGELRRRGVDTRRVARELREGRLALWAIDPLTVHDRVTD